MSSWACERRTSDGQTLPIRLTPVKAGLLILHGKCDKVELRPTIALFTDRIIYLRAVDLLKASETPLDLAAERYAAAVAKPGKIPLLDAVDYFVDRHPTNMPSKTLEEIVTEMLAAKKADGASAVYLRDLKIRLGRIVPEPLRGEQAATLALGKDGCPPGLWTTTPREVLQERWSLYRLPPGRRGNGLWRKSAACESPAECRMRKNRPSGSMRGRSQTVTGLGPLTPSALPTLQKSYSTS